MKTLVKLILLSTFLFSTPPGDELGIMDNKGLMIVKIYSSWSDDHYFDDEGISDYLNELKECGTCQIKVKEIENSKASSFVRSKRIRNFPSIVVIFDSKVKEIYKADIEGYLEVSKSEIESDIKKMVASRF